MNNRLHYSSGHDAKPGAHLQHFIHYYLGIYKNPQCYLEPLREPLAFCQEMQLIFCANYTAFIWPQKNTPLFEANLKGDPDCPVLMSCALISADLLPLPVSFEVYFSNRIMVWITE